MIRGCPSGLAAFFGFGKRGILSVENDEADMLHRNVEDLTELGPRKDFKGSMGRVNRNDGGIGHQGDDLSAPEHRPGRTKTIGIHDGLFPETKRLPVMRSKNPIAIFHLQVADCPFFRNCSIPREHERISTQKNFLDRIGDKQKDHSQNENDQKKRPSFGPPLFSLS